MKLACLFCMAALSARASPAPQVDSPEPAQHPPGRETYSVYSHDVGWNNIDMRITELDNEGQVFVFRIPGYAERTASGSRFVMCAFSQFALLNGFSHWVLQRPEAVASGGDDRVRVGFFVGELQDPAELFDASFQNDVPGTASLVAPMCKFFNPYTGEPPEV